VVTGDAERSLGRVVRETDEFVLALAEADQFALRVITEDGCACTELRRRGRTAAAIWTSGDGTLAATAVDAMRTAKTMIVVFMSNPRNHLNTQPGRQAPLAVLLLCGLLLTPFHQAPPEAQPSRDRQGVPHGPAGHQKY